MPRMVLSEWVLWILPRSPCSSYRQVSQTWLANAAWSKISLIVRRMLEQKATTAARFNYTVQDTGQFNWPVRGGQDG